MTERAPTVIDLFSGCGGGSIGFIAAGFAVAGAVEIDERAAASYELLTGVRPTLGDIRKVCRADLTALAPGQVTLLFGCPPCQCFTILRRGRKALPRDRIRNASPMEYLRLVEELRPRHVAFENVPGFSEGRSRDTFAAFKSRLEVLGYSSASEVVDAADFGVPQHRRRLLVVGSRVRQTQSTCGNPRARPSPIYNRTPSDRTSPVTRGERDPNDPMHFATPTIARAPDSCAGRRRSRRLAGGASLCAKDHGGHYDIYGRMRWDAPAPTLTSGCTNVTRGRFAHPDQHRAITLREALLLQAFPASAAVTGGVEAGSLQVGNAVPPLLAQRIGDAIFWRWSGSPERGRRQL